MSDKEKVVFETIFARRSIRQFIDGKPVEKEKVIKLLEMAMAAPSACNIQPWEFIVISDQEKIKEIKGIIFQGNYNTPLIIVVCGNPKFIPWENDIGITDCAAAIENMLLAATAMDLGSVWIGGFNPDDVKKLLSIPENVHPVGIVYFGYPAKNPEPRTQYTEQAVFWGKYDPDREQLKRTGCLV
jgi:nitroreductase